MHKTSIKWYLASCFMPLEKKRKAVGFIEIPKNGVWNKFKLILLPFIYIYLNRSAQWETGHKSYIKLFISEEYTAWYFAYAFIKYEISWNLNGETGAKILTILITNNVYWHRPSKIYTYINNFGFGLTINWWLAKPNWIQSTIKQHSIKKYLNCSEIYHTVGCLAGGIISRK